MVSQIAHARWYVSALFPFDEIRFSEAVKIRCWKVEVSAFEEATLCRLLRLSVLDSVVSMAKHPFLNCGISISC